MQQTTAIKDQNEQDACTQKRSMSLEKSAQHFVNNDNFNNKQIDKGRTNRLLARKGPSCLMAQTGHKDALLLVDLSFVSQRIASPNKAAIS